MATNQKVVFWNLDLSLHFLGVFCWMLNSVTIIMKLLAARDSIVFSQKTWFRVLTFLKWEPLKNSFEFTYNRYVLVSDFSLKILFEIFKLGKLFFFYFKRGISKNFMYSLYEYRICWTASTLFWKKKLRLSFLQTKKTF